MKRIVLGLAALAVVIGLFIQASQPELLIFNDGREMEVEHFELQGDSVVFATSDGTLHTVPARDVDLYKTASTNRLGHIGLATAQASALPVQDPVEGTMVVTSDGAPIANVEIFVLVNQGKQSVGTTNTSGQLPFDPAMMSAKIKVTVAVRECPQQTEVYIVSIQSGDACQAVEDASDEPDCSCEVAGAILWGSLISVDVTALTAGGASSLMSNPFLWGGIAAGVGTGVAIGASGSDDPQTSISTPQTPSGMTPVPTTAPVAMPQPTPAPPAPMIDFNGNYGLNVIQVRDPGGHVSYVILPPFIEIFVASNGSFRATGGQDFLRMNGSLNRDTGDFNSNGSGRVNGFNVQATFEGRIDPREPYRLTGWYRVGVNNGFPGGGAVEFRIDDTRQ